jgi:hypothetical protein
LRAFPAAAARGPEIAGLGLEEQAARALVRKLDKGWGPLSKFSTGAEVLEAFQIRTKKGVNLALLSKSQTDLKIIF